MRRKFSSAPKRIKCRMCNNMFDNPILNGSSVVTVVCQTCRTNLLGVKTRRAMARKATPTPEPTTRSEVPTPRAAQMEEFVFKCLNDYR